VLEGDDEDRPPVIEICVGRNAELDALKNSHARIIFITGLGGQGKSTLAARYYDECQDKSHFSLFVWRDCKEESERFETQLAAIVEKLSGGQITGKDLAQQTVESIIKLLLAHIRNIDALFIFDNVDHYVDIDKRKMLGSADVFIETLLNSSVSARVIFTCRPSVQYETLHSLSIPLGGIDLQATMSLFAARKANSKMRQIELAHRLTQGHAFWLDLLAVQSAQTEHGKDLDALLSDIANGVGPLPATTLNSIWSTLRDREQAVLRLMAETVKPESAAEISDYLRDTFTFNKISKALKVLRALNLVVIKRRPRGQDLLELHPLVRAFIRQSFTKVERVGYIHKIIKVYKGTLLKLQGRLSQHPTLSILQYWTQNAELDIAAGNFDDAFACILQVAHAFMSSAYPRELARVTRLLFESVDWLSEQERFPEFDRVFVTHIRTLAQLGATTELNALLDKYEHTVPNRDVRYIQYCSMRCYCLWFRGEFSDAVEWGRKGQGLFEESGVDSRQSSNITHTLALAERDAGRSEVALPVFLDGRRLADVVDPNELDINRSADHYGNIGRCLHFMGQIEAALVCYQKSALLIERSSNLGNVMNKGYARMWIGELLSGRGELATACAFLRSALRIWEQVAPTKTTSALRLLEKLQSRMGKPPILKDTDVEKICIDWIVGSSVKAALNTGQDVQPKLLETTRH
jgi:tetratricopeptide (TPR) repeat protein